MNEAVLELIESIKPRRIDFDKAAKHQLDVWRGRKVDRQPLLLSCELDNMDEGKHPAYNTKETHYNSEKMFYTGFTEMLSSVYGRADAVPSIRANMGCGIFPTLFGVEQQLFEDKMPWVKEHISKDKLQKMGPEDLKVGYEFKAGLDHMAYIAHILDGTGCRVYPMDLQGAFDTAHIVYGDAIFTDLYDDPSFVHHLLGLCCEAIFLGMEECFKAIPDSDSMITHYNNLVMPRTMGGIKISEDTSTLLSKAQIEEFVAPYLKRILAHFGGGYIHYCGKNPHLFETVMSEPLAYGLNFGNPDMHDMEYVLERCAQTGKIYYGGIPLREDESCDLFFSRLLKSSIARGRSILLLSYWCKKEDLDNVLNAWDIANKQAEIC